MTIDTARMILSGLWLGGSIFIFVLGLLLMVFTQRLKDAEKEFWDWLIPYIVPTLMLMFGVFVGQQITETAENPASLFLYRAAAALWLFYLIIFLVLVGKLFFETSEPTASMKFLKKFDTFIRSVQGLNTLILGAFFVA